MASNRFFQQYMKIILMVTLLHTAHCILSTDCNAQTWSEWFRQKRTQRRYLARQIALLKVYLNYVKEGYEIAEKGLTTIHNIKEGDFNLHRDFFGSLKNVNPNIANSARLADIIAFQADIIRTIKGVNNFCRNNEFFTPEEVRYVAAVYTNMLYLSDLSASELLTIIHPNEVEMTDDERLMRIDKLYEDALDKHAFAKSFDNDVRLMAREREREKNAIERLRKQNGLL